VGVLALPRVSELRDRTRLAERDEDRVVAEALVSARRRRDRPLEHAGAAALPFGSERHELADVARAAVLDTVERGEKRGEGVVGPARGLDPRPPPERRDLDPRVLAEHPPLGERPPEAGLAERVLVVRRAVLGRERLGVQQLELPAG
jgi:hypothetical protein